MFRREFFKNGILGGLIGAVFAKETITTEATPVENMVGEFKQGEPINWTELEVKQEPKFRIWKLGSLEHRLSPTREAAEKLAKMLEQAKDGEITVIIWGPDIDVIEVGGNKRDVVVDEEYCVQFLKHSDRYSVIDWDNNRAFQPTTFNYATTGSPLVNRPLGMNGISDDDIVKAWQLNYQIMGT